MFFSLLVYAKQAMTNVQAAQIKASIVEVRGSGSFGGSVGFCSAGDSMVEGWFGLV